MRKGFFIVTAATLAVAGASALSVKGNGTVVTQERDLSGFTSVSATSVEEVSIEKGNEFSVTVTMDQNLLSSYETNVSGGTLHLGFKSGVSVSAITKLHVHVVMPELRSVSGSGTGTFTIAKGFSGAEFAASLSGTGSLRAHLDYKKVRIDISGTGQAELSGKADDVKVAISGAGSLSGRSFQARTATLSISGTGSMKISVTDNLDAVISGLGSIIYYGSPKVDQRISGLGSVQRG
ncbi:MAG: DUF2807 domain-containing protein [Spirochaetales bacterium]|nr:DUF2807 domain-containing protein [Spirochaetales bacterium]MBP7264762.1 DUF2807 domain-containing protein [Spirochaetia bacterium]